MTDAAPEPKPPPKRENPRPWPTYGYDAARTHISPYDHRPPYRRLWSADAHDTLEFPPTIGYGRLYLAQQKGLFFALDAKTGKVDWTQEPPPLRGVVAHDRRRRRLPVLHAPVVCQQGQAGADGFVVAWNANTGRERWRFKTAPIESSPLLRNGALYVGSWDHKSTRSTPRPAAGSGPSRPTTR